jgi:hypothetical protein
MADNRRMAMGPKKKAAQKSMASRTKKVMGANDGQKPKTSRGSKKSLISKRQALMAERINRGPNKRRVVGEPPNRSMTNRAKNYQKSKSDAIRKGNPGAKKFQQPKGRRGNG